MTKLREDDSAFLKIAALLKKWVKELPCQNIDDEKPPSPRDPLRDMRKILGYVKPQPNPWAQCVRAESIDVARSGIYALGNIISHHEPRLKLVASAEKVLGSLRGRGSIEAKPTIRTRDELLQHVPLDDDVYLWTSFTESLRGAGIQVGTGPGTATGQPSSGVPEFSDITTVDWQPNEDYLKAARQVVMQLYPASRREMPFLIVVGIKTVRGHTIQSADLAQRQGSPGGGECESSPASKMPEDLVIACIFKDIREGPASDCDI